MEMSWIPDHFSSQVGMDGERQTLSGTSLLHSMTTLMKGKVV